MQTVNEHGTVTVAIIIVTLASITNIISGVSNPGSGSSIYGSTIDHLEHFLTMFKLIPIGYVVVCSVN